jgi:hypothetical protein
MRLLAIPLVLAVMLTPAATAAAQTPAVSAKPAPGQTISQVITSGFTYTVGSSAAIDLSAKLTVRYRGRTVTITKSVRAESNYGQSPDPVEYSMPAATESAAAVLRKFKNSATVTLTVKVTGTGGFRTTLVKTTKLAKG